METLKKLNIFTKTILIIGATLVLYGYLARLVGIYFLWESKAIGWTFFFLGVIGVLSNRIRIKKGENKKAIPEKIVIGLLVFILFLQTILIITIPFTDAYSTAKLTVKSDAKLKSILGNVTGFGLIPTGAIQKSTNSEGEYGSATINLTIKGDEKYMDATIYVTKYIDTTAWIVERIEY